MTQTIQTIIAKLRKFNYQPLPESSQISNSPSIEAINSLVEETNRNTYIIKIDKIYEGLNNLKKSKEELQDKLEILQKTIDVSEEKSASFLSEIEEKVNLLKTDNVMYLNN